MSTSLSTATVWTELAKRSFAILSWATPRGEPRAAGIVYTLHKQKLYIGTEPDAWKARHIAATGAVTLTVTVPRGRWLPIAIPDATITFPGHAAVLSVGDVPSEVVGALTQGMANAEALTRTMAVLCIEPRGHFLTYGIGVSLLQMRDPALAAGRVPVA